MIGGAGSDNHNGGAGNDSLNGQAGDDLMYGGIGDDVQLGTDGDDTFFIEDNFGADTITGGESDETTGDTPWSGHINLESDLARCESGICR